MLYNLIIGLLDKLKKKMDIVPLYGYAWLKIVFSDCLRFRHNPELIII